MADQNQKSGEGSTNLQVAGDLVVGGVSIAEARQIAIDVMRAELGTLTEDAFEKFNNRVTEFADALVTNLAEKSPESLESFKQPDTQFAIHAAQKEYGKTGDRKLRDLLLGLLGDIFEQEERSLKKIVLGESVQVAGKLTQDQINTLTVIYLIKYTRQGGVVTHSDFKKYLTAYLVPFSQSLSTSDARFQHLEFAGCGTMGMGRNALSSIFKTQYPSVFASGFPHTEIDGSAIPKAAWSALTFPCQNDAELLQLHVSHADDIDGLFSANKWPDDEKAKFKQLLERTIPDQHVLNLVAELCPEMQSVIDFWQNTPAKRMQLTSVGIAIGHANLKRQTGHDPNLDIWIN